MKEKNNLLNDKILKKNQRFFYLDYLRIISSFFVILIHISSPYYYKYDINSSKWKNAHFYKSLSSFSVPNFFMISGTVFLKKNLSFKIIISKYIKNIFMHLLLWSIIYAFFEIKKATLDIKNILILIIKGHYHLWYLFAIIGLYITIPFTSKIVQNKELLNSFLFLYFIFVFAVPNYIDIFRYYSNDIFNSIQYIISRVNLSTISVHHFYFIYGYYLNNKKFKKKEVIIYYIAGLIGILFTTIICYDFSIIKKKKIRYYKAQDLNNFFYSIGVFIFFKNNFNLGESSNNKMVQKLSKLTFGIYLIHPLIIENIIKYIVFKLDFSLEILLPIISFIVFLLSFIFSIILSHIPLLGKYLV